MPNLCASCLHLPTKWADDKVGEQHPGEVLGLPGGKGTWAGAHAAFAHSHLSEGAALNPGVGPGERGLHAVSAPTHPFGWMLLGSERTALLHLVTPV